MKIKTRKKKKPDRGIVNEGQYKHTPKGRPKELIGFEGQGMYTYDYRSNRAEKIDTTTLTVRFYQTETDYIELDPNKDYLIARSMGEGLRRITVRAHACNWFELRCIGAPIENEKDRSRWE